MLVSAPIDVQEYVSILEHWCLLIRHLDSRRKFYHIDKFNIVV